MADGKVFEKLKDLSSIISEQDAKEVVTILSKSPTKNEEIRIGLSALLNFAISSKKNANSLLLLGISKAITKIVTSSKDPIIIALANSVMSFVGLSPEGTPQKAVLQSLAITFTMLFGHHEEKVITEACQGIIALFSPPKNNSSSKSISNTIPQNTPFLTEDISTEILNRVTFLISCPSSSSSSSSNSSLFVPPQGATQIVTSEAKVILLGSVFDMFRKKIINIESLGTKKEPEISEKSSNSSSRGSISTNEKASLLNNTFLLSLSSFLSALKKMAEENAEDEEWSLALTITGLLSFLSKYDIPKILDGSRSGKVIPIAAEVKISLPKDYPIKFNPTSLTNDPRTKITDNSVASSTTGWVTFFIDTEITKGIFQCSATLNGPTEIFGISTTQIAQNNSLEKTHLQKPNCVSFFCAYNQCMSCVGSSADSYIPDWINTTRSFKMMLDVDMDKRTLHIFGDNVQRPYAVTNLPASVNFGFSLLTGSATNISLREVSSPSISPALPCKDIPWRDK